MAWTTPLHNRGRVDAAGTCLSTEGPGGPTETQRDEALFVINNWRSSHGYPLQVLKMTLLKRAKKIDSKALVAQRTKRLSSIIIKLKRNDGMQLSRMHDLGGCRAVMRSVRAVDRLIKQHEKSSGKNPHVRPELIRKYDYIRHPKEDGYRSVHLVYKYRTGSTERSAFNGLRIEIQLRSRLQHAWATAVETASTFTGQALKSNIGEPAWKRFFALMGSAIALREKCPKVPGTPTDKQELIKELRLVAKELRIEAVLKSWQVVVDVLGKKSDVHAYLMILDSSTRKISVEPFKRDELLSADTRYLEIEKQNSDNPNIQAVLVSVTSLQALKSAYPNYYLDTTAFLAAFRAAIG